MINPLALIFIGLAAVIGALLGHWLIGLGAGLAIVLIASVIEP